jgi:hypothetical protein
MSQAVKHEALCEEAGELYSGLCLLRRHTSLGKHSTGTPAAEMDQHPLWIGRSYSGRSLSMRVQTIVIGRPTSGNLLGQEVSRAENFNV